MEALQKVLFDEYNRDPRRKNYKNLNYYTIDNRTRKNLNAKGQPNGAFCVIYAKLISKDEVEVRLQNIPVDKYVIYWAERNNAEYSDITSKCLSFIITKENKSIITELAELVLDIKSRPYEVRSYYGSCPEVYNSLNKFYNILQQHWV